MARNSSEDVASVDFTAGIFQQVTRLIAESHLADTKAQRANLKIGFDTLCSHVNALGNSLHLDAVANCAKILALRFGNEFQFNPSEMRQELRSVPPFDESDLFTDGKLCGIKAAGLPGISLVTCAMNRTENLLRALPSWLSHDEISEIIIVDWSSKEEVRNALMDAGMTDPRIRVLRVDDEPRWILSYAFNCGFRAARFNSILKVDADIVLSSDFFLKNHLVHRSFIAGNWRTAASGQNYVNGFFYVPKAALAVVGGFSEYITTYGWDDDDIYSRLLEAGYQRFDVMPACVHHLPHSDDDRINAPREEDGETLLHSFMEGTRFLIRRNRYIAALMPTWNERSHLVDFHNTGLDRDLGELRLRRGAGVPAVVPDHTMETARFHALLDFLYWKVGPRALQLDAPLLNAVLCRPANLVSLLDVEVALAAGASALAGKNGYLVVRIARLPAEQATETKAVKKIIQTLVKSGLQVIFTGNPESIRELTHSGWKDAVIVQTARIPSGLKAMTPGALIQRTFDPTQDHQIELDDLWDVSAFSTPPQHVKRKRIYVDAQHGLGNRLRAIASAQAIAEETNRDLIVIWEPDDHCMARLDDLFDYDGPVVDHRFLEDAPGMGIIVQNYMPHEMGAQKDATIRVDSPADLYLRSAFVFNSPHSDWGRENAALRALRPNQHVLDLVASVRNPNAISAHVRMEAGAGRDQNAWDQSENWRPEDHELIHLWREKSHFSHFLKRIDALTEQGRADTIFLAADLPETYELFAARYGTRLAFLQRSVYDRSSEQLVYALADALLLGRAPLMLGSTWSSFSELAMRMVPGEIKVEMSGTDF